MKKMIAGWLAATVAGLGTPPVRPVVMISEGEARKIVDEPARRGLLEGAGKPADSARAIPSAAYVLRVRRMHGSRLLVYRRILRCDRATVEDLKALRDGDAERRCRAAYVSVFYEHNFTRPTSTLRRLRLHVWTDVRAILRQFEEDLKEQTK